MPGVLHVCTANQCRSAIAERISRAVLPADVPVTSCGTRARPGRPIWPEAADELQRRGISALGFVSQPLDPAVVTGADLVLTATRRHRDAVLAQFPTVLGRAFTWRELAWLLGGLTPGDVPGETVAQRVAVLPEVARSRRGHVATPDPDTLDVADPVGGSPGATAVAAEQIEQALTPVLRLLVG